MIQFAIDHLFYWMLGAFMVYATIMSGNKDLMQVQVKPLKKWVMFLVFLTAYRFVMLRFFTDQAFLQNAANVVASVPVAAAFTVFWEDMAFAVPLVLLKRLSEKTKWYKYAKWAALALMMAAFGSGHIYQGWPAVVATSLYVPLSMTRGQAIGFGTMILCHMLYDASTIMAIRMALGI